MAFFAKGHFPVHRQRWRRGTLAILGHPPRAAVRGDRGVWYFTSKVIVRKIGALERRSRIAAVTLGLLLTGLTEGPAEATPQETAKPVPSRPGTASELLDRLEAGFQSRDLEGLMGLLELPDESAREAERGLLRTLFEAEEVALVLQRPASVAASATRLRGERAGLPRERAPGPRRPVALPPREEGRDWAVAAREDLGDIDGLLHLSLDPRGFKRRRARHPARGLRAPIPPRGRSTRLRTTWARPSSSSWARAR